MAQRGPIKLILNRIPESVAVDSRKTTVVATKDKVQIDDAYKDFFASLLKIKDRDVQRRVLQAVNGENVTCANCANKIQSKGLSVTKKSTNPTSFSFATQTLEKDFEFLKKINSPVRTAATTTTKISTECHLLNKIQLGRSRRKFEPYAVKTEKEKCNIPSKKVNYLRYTTYEPDRLLKKIHKPLTKTEHVPIETTPKDVSITQELLFDNLEVDHSMTPHGFFNFESNEQPTKFNDFVLFSTMEEEIRTASVLNEEGLYTIHIATINGDLFKLRRLMVIYNFNKWDVNIRSEDGKGESPLHFAMSCTNNDRNNEIIHLLYNNGADVLATNDVGDTALHLAAETIVDFGVIRKLLSKISLNDLSKQNDKGQTILHIAAVSENRVFVKSILSLIDGKLNISSIGKDIPFTNATEHFMQLDALHLNYVKTFISENFRKPEINPVKSKILNAQDGRSGKTAIFLALEKNDQSTCLMLLAHFVDTRIEDFGNTSCALYSTEVLRNRVLAQAIYNTDSMHNSLVFKTLKQNERHRINESRKRVPQDEIDCDDSDDIMSKVAKVLS